MGFAAGLALDGEPEGVVDEAVEEGVGQGGVGETFVPGIDGDLGGDQGRGAVVTVIEDLQQVTGLSGSEGVAQPVVEDEQVGSGDGVEELWVGAVGPSQLQGREQARGALVAHGGVVAAGSVAEGAGEVGFAGTGGSGDDDVEVAAHPVGLGEFEDQGSGKPRGGRRGRGPRRKRAP